MDELNKNRFLIKRYQFRKNIIGYIYQYELFDKTLDSKEIVDNELNVLNDKEIKTLKIIESKHEIIQNIAKNFISKNWDWIRINPLTRAIIIFGIYELTYNDSKVVINEMINISKIFSPNDDYKFINKVLDLVDKNIIKK
ncbi:transcription antitermination protein NusB [Mycoplasma enhydrae]|uniref:transcription antitermination factor NusB n=1 Tax=Mycoplasma enhydrae TaxID=2499220 RepID=UPI00197B4646|nr:transcription antitermination factor NusB [Mycoplasma enhydrae]MBN4089411.1 transcription antitermination protein NusB [Mycoplasma enhydrae]MCV3733467.1 transcription antitermination protein NusB [Mycoplasma enhydrae]MCV3753285.1 transcription antitermination protein NusB [Mycoplasma enhydrae]